MVNWGAGRWEVSWAGNDLGWSLFEAGRLDEAREHLERAASMDPAEGLAQENLRLCREAIEGRKGRHG